MVNFLPIFKRDRSHFSILQDRLDLCKTLIVLGCKICLQQIVGDCLTNLEIKSLKSEATLSATQFFKRSYKISHKPGLYRGVFKILVLWVLKVNKIFI